MKKISELTGDEFFDVICALSPILSVIADMEVVQAQLFSNYNPEISKARATVALNNVLIKKGGKPEKIEQYNKEIIAANEVIKAEISGLFARDMSKIIPVLCSKDNRGCVFETIAIMDGLPVDEVKKYSAPKVVTKIKDIFQDTSFKSFLSYAEESEPTE